MALLIAMCVTPACLRSTARPRAQVLHLDATDPKQSRICRLSTPATDATTAVEESCTLWSGASIDPGQLTIDVRRQQPDVRYDVKVGAIPAGASPEDAQAVLSEVANRVVKLMDTALRDAPALGRRIAVDAAKDAAPALVSALVAHSGVSAATSPRPPVERIWDAYLVAGALAKPDDTRKTFAAELDPILNEPFNHPPPPRAYRLTADDRKHLDTAGVKADALAALVKDWCNVESFAAAARPVYAALREAPNVAALDAALQIDTSDLAAALAGRSTAEPLRRRITALIEASRTGTLETMTPAARAFYLMRVSYTLVVRIEVCQANLAFAGAATPSDLTELLGQARVHAAAMTQVMGPLLRGSLPRAVSLAEADAGGHFGTFPLEPGSLEVTLGATRNDQHQDIAHLKADVAGMPRFAIVIGPGFTMCKASWGCFDSFHEITDERGRLVARQHEQFDLSLTTALHVTLWAKRRWGVGAVLGYPLGTPKASTYNVIAGVGWRHRAGIEVVLGAHAFRSPELKDAYRAKTPIKLYEGGRDDLTIDEMVEDRLRAGAFLMIGFEPSLFSKL